MSRRGGGVAAAVSRHKHDENLGFVQGDTSSKDYSGPKRLILERLEAVEYQPDDDGKPRLRRTTREESRELLNSAAEDLKANLKQGGSFRADVETTEEDESLGKAAPKNYTESRWFGIVIAAAILANAIQMGVETDHPDLPGYVVVENLFTGIFTWEMFSKQYFERCRYFSNRWNCLDFVLVWMSIVDCWVMGLLMGGGGDMSKFSSLRILRVLRVVRMIRLLKVFKELWLIVKGMIDSVRTIFWASLLLLMLFYVCGILCTQLIGQNTTAGYYRAVDYIPKEQWEEVDYHPDFDPHQYFGNVPRSMFTLFETCLEPLNIRAVIEKQPFMLPFFLAFIFLTTFGVMNVIIGVIVDNTMEASKQTQLDLDAIETMAKIDKVERIRDACFLFDEDGNGLITLDEVRKGLEDSTIQDFLKDLELPIGTSAEEFFDLLDVNGEGSVTYSKMMKSLFRSIAQDQTQSLLELKIELHQFERFANDSVTNLETHLETAEERLISKLDWISAFLEQGDTTTGTSRAGVGGGSGSASPLREAASPGANDNAAGIRDRALAAGIGHPGEEEMTGQEPQENDEEDGSPESPNKRKMGSSREVSGSHGTPGSARRSVADPESLGTPESARRSARRICQFFEMGNCKLGENCPLPHIRRSQEASTQEA